ncbi:hypothetical protein EXIGLDRAFT_745199 [Exidia glandulosa HHB12029]|uniref:Protein kinase domain-containing protein n=1 Tax=Exidia glandulosa HHB12029 TaxID=1314781 RepID=A0A165NTM1_EXIGL|nr:hypothetical protein EXIGLDRAFT_745199 [Exidia glandulosa HHB12029]
MWIEKPTPEFWKRRIPGGWCPSEETWVSLQPFLLEQGYSLRARFQPDWTPSWNGLDDFFLFSDVEDGVRHERFSILDATRTLDGTPVILKAVHKQIDPSEAIGEYFASEPQRSDPRNHCAPLLGVLHPPTRPEWAILVYHRYVPWHIWPFRRVSEIVDLWTQAFEGLAFMHQHNTAHLDCSFSNIVMDGLHLLKEPNHPANPGYTYAPRRRSVRHIERFESERPVKYIFIDFDQSVRFGPDNPNHLWRRRKGQDNTAPELRSPDPYDAFALDVYCLGHMILTHWLNAYKNLEFVRPLVQDMMHQDPARRPTALDVEARFRVIAAQLSAKDLRKSPRRVHGYDFTEYILGNVPARVPPQASTDDSLLSKLFRRRRVASTPNRPTPSGGSSFATADDLSTRMASEPRQS